MPNKTTLIAKVSTTVKAPVEMVWEALVNPGIIKQYMFGAEVVSNWEEGASILWRGDWQGKKYEDKGTILKLKPPRLLQYSHFSPLSGLPDIPENYHTVTIDLSPDQNGTLVTLAQDNNPDEDSRQHSEQNWAMMLSSLKRVVEK
jgi:uncharacterized protein YndB with AHSA1/START domain